MPTKEIDDVLKRVGDLIALTNNPNEEEARTAAVKATALMREHRLVLVPESEIERVKTVIGEAQALAAKHQQEGNQRMMLAGLAGFFLGGKGFKL